MISKWPTMALPLPLSSGIWFFPTLNRVTELIKTKARFIAIIINSHIFNIYFLTLILIWEMLNHIPPDPSCQLDIPLHHNNVFAMDVT